MTTTQHTLGNLPALVEVMGYFWSKESGTLPQRLGRISILLSWHICFLSFASSLGTSSFGTGITVGLITMALELYILRRRNKQQGKVNKNRVGGVKKGVETLGQKPQNYVPAPHNAQAEITTPRGVESVHQVSSTQEFAHKIPLQCRWRIIGARVLLIILWLLAFSLTIVMGVWVGEEWNRWPLVGIIFENIMCFIQAVVMGISTVVAIMERERFFREGPGERLEAGLGGIQL